MSSSNPLPDRPATDAQVAAHVPDPALVPTSAGPGGTRANAQAGQPGSDPDWWRQAVVYQVYPRSFADANGDGLGDIRGVTSRVPYLRDLGVDAVWLSPFYPSQLADGGYDVDDYREVDPRLGTLADVDELIAALHAAGIRLIVDIVPNHTSDQHRLFRAALAAGPGSPERANYHFRDGRGADGSQPPSDWVAAFGGSAWERVEDGQWYLHLFAPEQPDLNWDSPAVRDEFLRTIRFWSERGVDGFRIDVAQLLAKDIPADPEQIPSQAEIDARPDTDGAHPLRDRDEVHEIYAGWREVMDQFDPPRMAVAEAWVSSPERRARYARPGSLGQAFTFDLLEADFDAVQFRRLISENLAAAHAAASSTTWVLSNHDVVRHATRYGLPPRAGDTRKGGNRWLLAGGKQEDVDVTGGLRRARAASLFLLALPGSMYLYQGEELGLPEVGDIPDAARQDPTFFRSPGEDVGRDGCRVPIPWESDGPSFGFGDAQPHLPQPDSFADMSVAAQTGQEGSTLELYRRALHLRRELQGPETLDWGDTGRDDVLHIRRPGGWSALLNTGVQPFELPAGEVLIASSELDEGALAAQSAVWLRESARG